MLNRASAFCLLSIPARQNVSCIYAAIIKKKTPNCAAFDNYMFLHRDSYASVHVTRRFSRISTLAPQLSRKEPASYGLFKSFLLLLPLYKPTPDIVPGLIGAAFKKQKALFPVDQHRVPVALAAGAHGGGLSDIGHAVDLIVRPVLPGDHPREHDAVRTELDFDRDVNLQAVCVHHSSSLSPSSSAASSFARKEIARDVAKPSKRTMCAPLAVSMSTTVPSPMIA